MQIIFASFLYYDVIIGKLEQLRGIFILFLEILRKSMMQVEYTVWFEKNLSSNIAKKYNIF